MRLRALLLSSLVVVGALVVAGCAGSGKPDTSSLVASSLRAAAGQKDMKVHYAVTAKVNATPSALASEQTRQWLSQPLSLTASGALSKDAMTLAGNVAFTGKSFHAEALVGQHETFINLLGTWYGDRTKGLDDAQHSAEDKSASKVSPQQLKKTLRWVYDHSDEVLDAQVTPGPAIDGKTWQATGHCKADGIAKLAQKNGQIISGQERKDIATFCRLTKVTYVAGADDHLPRELRIAAHFDKQRLTELAAEDDSTKELDALNIELDVKLSQWGKDVTYTAPANPKSMDDLGAAVLGLLFQAAS
jgi:outer membrane murein-binding lipoprotein Lpp